MNKFRFSAPADDVAWEEMQVNLVDHCISATRENGIASFEGGEDALDEFVSKHYDGSGIEIILSPVPAQRMRHHP